MVNNLTVIPRVTPPQPVKFPEHNHLTDTRMHSLELITDKFKGIHIGSQTCRRKNA